MVSTANFSQPKIKPKSSPLSALAGVALLAGSAFLSSALLSPASSAYATTSITDINEVLFGGAPDDNFASCLLEAYATANSTTVDALFEAFVSDPDSVFTESGQAAVTTISCKNQTNLDVNTIDLFPNLTELHLDGSTISSLHLYNHPKLAVLDLTGATFYANHFGDNEGDAAPNLQTLYLRQSNIKFYYPSAHPNLSNLFSDDIHIWTDPAEHYFSLTDSGESFEMDLSSLAFLAENSHETYSVYRVIGVTYGDYVGKDITADYSISDQVITAKKTDSLYRTDQITLKHTLNDETGAVSNLITIPVWPAYVGVKIGFDTAIIPTLNGDTIEYLSSGGVLQNYYVGDVIDSDLFADEYLSLAQTTAADANRTATLDHLALTSVETIVEDSSHIQYTVRPSDVSKGHSLDYWFNTAEKASDVKTPNTGLFTNSDGSLKPSAILFTLASLTTISLVGAFLGLRLKKSHSIRRF